MHMMHNLAVCYCPIIYNSIIQFHICILFMMKSSHIVYLTTALASVFPSAAWAYTSTVNTGQTVSDEVVDTGRQNVYGITNNVTVTNNGMQYVYGGGIVNHTTINDSGQLSTEQGSTVNDVVLNSGSVMIYGVANRATITGGSFQVNGILNSANVTGGSISLNVGQNGLVDPYTGGRANNVTLTNATLGNRFGVDTDTVVNQGGILKTGYATDYGWTNTAISERATINQGGLQSVDNGGTSIGTLVNTGGRLELLYTMHDEYTWDTAPPARGTANDSVIYGTMVSSGGADNNTTIKAGGVFNLSGNASNGFKGESSRATIEQGGSAYLASDAYATEWTIQGLANLTSYSAVIENSTVGSGGMLQVDAGNAIGTTVNSGGRVAVNAGAVLNNATINGDLVAASYSNLLGNIAVNSGGVAEVHAAANTALAQMAVAGHLYLNNSNIAPAGHDFAFDTLQMNGGSVTFGAAPGSTASLFADTASTLTLNGLSGNGTFYMNTAIDGLSGNKLNVTGQADGYFNVHVSDTGANPTHEDSLQLIQIASGNADFQLGNAGGVVDVGTYQYEMVADGQGGWFLQPKTQGPVIIPENPSIPEDYRPAYQITPSAESVISMASVSPLIFNAEMDRIGQQINNRCAPTHGNDVWAIVSVGHQHVALDRADYKMDLSGVAFGIDQALEVGNGSYTQGIFASYSRADVDFERGGSGDVNAYGVGVYGSYVHDNGFYLDGIVKANLFRHNVSPVMTSGGKATGRYSTYGIGLKVEGGRYFHIGNTYVAPFVAASSFVSEPGNYWLSNGMQAYADNQASVVGSAGLQVGHTLTLNGTTVEPYVRVALEHEFIDTNKVTINRVDDFQNDLSGSRGALHMGLNVGFSNALSLQLNAGYRNGRHIEAPWTVNFNLSYQF